MYCQRDVRPGPGNLWHVLDAGLSILMRLSQALPRHSPSLRTQSERCGEVLGLGQRQGLGEGVGHRVVHGVWRGANGCRLDVQVVAGLGVLDLRVVLLAARGRQGCW